MEYAGKQLATGAYVCYNTDIYTQIEFFNVILELIFIEDSLEQKKNHSPE